MIVGVSHTGGLGELPQLKIIGAVVGAVAVDVMNLLMGLKGAAKSLLHDVAVLEHPATTGGAVSGPAAWGSVGDFDDLVTRPVAAVTNRARRNDHLIETLGGTEAAFGVPFDNEGHPTMFAFACSATASNRTILLAVARRCVDVAALRTWPWLSLSFHTNIIRHYEGNILNSKYAPPSPGACDVSSVGCDRYSGSRRIEPDSYRGSARGAGVLMDGEPVGGVAADG